MKPVPMDVVMCTWNSNRSFFEKCLESIRREIPVHHFIVVDRFSRDGTIDVVKKHFETVVVYLSGENLARNRMIGIGLVDTEYFVFMDDDLELPKGWFERVTSHIDNRVGAIHEGVIWAGRECMDNSLLNRLISDKWMQASLSFTQHRMVIMDITLDNILESIGFAQGGHTIVKTDVVRDWKPSSHISAAEDILMMKHIVKKGYVWRILEHHTVKHYSPRNLSQHLNKQRWHIAGLRAAGFGRPSSQMLSNFLRQSLNAFIKSVKFKDPMIFAHVFFNGLVVLDGHLRWNKFYKV